VATGTMRTVRAVCRASAAFSIGTRKTLAPSR
jgi:hypothetical protein